LPQLFAGGGSVIDPSPSYGAAERIVGELLSSLNARDKAFIATKLVREETEMMAYSLCKNLECNLQTILN
jgi:aryl-alcohol dehydrogenase-like predicted oxidoreductase